MESFIKVLNVFNTSIGQIAILMFPTTTKPFMGLILQDESRSEWKIVGIGMGIKGRAINEVKEEDYQYVDRIWDCKLQLISEKGVLQKESKLFINPSYP